MAQRENRENEYPHVDTINVHDVRRVNVSYDPEHDMV